MSQLPVLVVLLPLLTAIACLLFGDRGVGDRGIGDRGGGERGIERERPATRPEGPSAPGGSGESIPADVPGWAVQNWISGVSLATMVALSVWMLVVTGQGEILVYRVANWPAPFAITLVADRLGAVMVALTAILALAVHLSVALGRDREGPFFHALLQFQVMGLCGAFVTGDLFNLFVFFEILLIASYALLMYGGGGARTRAALHYVALNLAGSAVFLLAIGILYGLLGTLNLADLAAKAAALPAGDVPLARAAGGLLLVVFGLKAAVFPMNVWLPATYHAAAAPVSALFAIMTKVGVYAIIRIFVPVFGPGQGGVAGVADPWVLWLGLATLGVGTAGVMAALDLKRLVTFLVVASVGTQLTAVGLFSEAGLAAAVFYIIHSTFLTAGLFLLAAAIIHQRGAIGGRLSSGPVMHQGRMLGMAFLLAAMSAVGLPPLSGFLSKALILAATPPEVRALVWAIVLTASFLTLVQLARVGSVLFWNVAGDAAPVGPAPRAIAALGPGIALLAASVLIAVAGGPLDRFSRATAAAIYDRDGMVERVLGDDEPVPKTRSDRPTSPSGFVRRPQAHGATP